MFFNCKSCVFKSHACWGGITLLGDQTALNSGCKKIEILPLKHLLLVKGLVCHFGTRELTLRNKNHSSNDLNQT